MKTADQWAREWKWDCLPPEEKQAIRAIQADALRHAAELCHARSKTLTDMSREPEAKADDLLDRAFDCIAMQEDIEAEAAKLEGK